MPATSWTESTVTGTGWGNSRYIQDVGVTMNDTGYTMNDTVITINDQTENPIFGQPTAFIESTPSATAWTRS